MRQAAGSGADRLFIDGIDAYVPFARIRAAYDAGGWLCGLALFPATPHYLEKELTKFFEYMLAGLPILCSNFPAWRDLIEKEQVGLCVPPDDAEQIAAAIAWLGSHPREAEDMGRRGQKLVLERFNWQAEARKFVEFYGRVLS
jgi:glycosyltransferase involved in cell wall biosynthesis